MGGNNEIRKKIKGQLRMLGEHEAKVREELESSNPREYLITYLQKRICEVELEILPMQEQLRRR